MKNWVKRKLLDTRALRLLARFQDSAAAILMFHSVQADPSRHVDSLGGIIHSEAAFSTQMELLARDYHPISLDQLTAHIRGAEKFPVRAVVVTFDDGYADNFEIALPILNRYAVPATFYATAHCIAARTLPWPSHLRFAIRTTKLRTWNSSPDKSWDLDEPAAREQAFLACCDLCCQLSGDAQNRFVSQIERELDAQLPSESGSLMMSYEQLRQLTQYGHIVGSHTMTHPNMAYLKEDDAHRELAESRRVLESELAGPVQHFSYPCPALSPHWSKETVEQSQALGYATAVTTDSGLVRSGDNLLCLKRIHPTKTVEGLRWNLENAFAGRRV